MLLFATIVSSTKIGNGCSKTRFIVLFDVELHYKEHKHPELCLIHTGDGGAEIVGSSVINSLHQMIMKFNARSGISRSVGVLCLTTTEQSRFLVLGLASYFARQCGWHRTFVIGQYLGCVIIIIQSTNS